MATSSFRSIGRISPLGRRTIGQPLPRKPVRTLLSAILLAVALILGGGGSRFPATELVVQCVALIVLAYMVAEYRRDRAGTFDWLALGLLALIIILPLAQMIPLPATLWSTLPGRTFPAEAAAYLGLEGKPAALSLIPDATLTSALALLVPAAMFIATLQADGREIRLLLWVVLGAALPGAILGALQVAFGNGDELYLYITSHQGLPTGFFANRNHQADLMVIAFLCAWLLARDRRRKGRALAVRWGLFGVMILFAAAALATASRTGSVLLLIAIGTVFIPLMLQRNRPAALIGLGVAGATAVAVGLLVQTSAFQTLLGRFSQEEDNRFDFWPDVVYAIRDFWPAGSGFGTFDPVFRSVENLTALGSHYINHAHSDYLEIALEGGLPAVILLALFFLFLAAAAWRMLRAPQSGPEGRRGWIAMTGIVLLLLHSIVDYPLRTFALAALFAFLCGLLVRALRSDSSPGENETPSVSDDGKG